MVVPEGTLFRGGAFGTIKQDLLESFHLHTVVSLPPGTFAPYSDVKTALLFFELPLPEGLKKFSKGHPIRDEHFDEARTLWAAWDAYRRGDGPRPEPTAHSWVVSAKQVKERGYDLSARNPNRDEAETYRHPAEITASLLEVERQILGIIQELHEMVGNGNDRPI